MKDYYDIHTWTEKPNKFFKYISNKDKSKIKLEWQSPLNIDTVKIFALLKDTISQKPNGFYSFVQQGLPLDNIIWWDYVLESDKGFIHIWRTASVLEAMYHFEDGNFDLNKFLHSNINKYSKNINDTISKFEKHTVYINHYRSYKDCVEFLWKEIETLNLTPPVSPERHVIDEAIYNPYKDNIKRFIDNSVKFHTLGKSLVLNAAFQIESFLNLVIRLGASPRLKEYPDVLKKHLNSSFNDRLKNLKFYSEILNNDIDLENNAIKQTKELMTLRNKYVHFDESSVYNKIGEVFFDGDYPLHPIAEETPAVDLIIKIFHRPDFNTVKKSYETSKEFNDYIQNLFVPEFKESIIYLVGNNPIGYNETRKVYSAIYNQLAVDFYIPFSEEQKQ